MKKQIKQIIGILVFFLVTNTAASQAQFSISESFCDLKTTTGESVSAVLEEVLSLKDDRLLEAIEGGIAQNEVDLKILLSDLGLDLSTYEVSGLLKSGIQITGHAWDASVGTVFRVLSYPVRKDKKLRDALRFGRKSSNKLGKETLSFAKGPVVIVNDVLILALNNAVFAVKIVGSSADSVAYFVTEGAQRDPRVQYVRKGTRVSQRR